jgi:hypothetical protein
MSTDVSEEHIVSIFRVEEISSARNQQASKCLLATCWFLAKDGDDKFLRNVG